MFSYLVKCATWNVTTPFVKSAGLDSCSVISVQRDVSSSESINNLTCASLNERFPQSFLFACSEVGIVIIAGSTSWMAGAHAMWRTGQIISLSSNHCCGISWTCKKSTRYNRPKQNNLLSTKVPELNAFYGQCLRKEGKVVFIKKVRCFWSLDFFKLSGIEYFLMEQYLSTVIARV